MKMTTEEKRLRMLKHRKKYAEVGRQLKDIVSGRFSIDALKVELEKDEHLNGIPLRVWDDLAIINMHILKRIIPRKLHHAKSTYVCALKEAAEQLVEDYCHENSIKTTNRNSVEARKNRIIGRRLDNADDD